jgi:hypothetical protein
VKLLQAAFNASDIAIAVFLAHLSFNLAEWDRLAFEFPLKLSVAAVVYFLANTIPVATAISLTEDRKLVTVWKDCYFWSLAYYLVGAAFAWGLHVMNQNFGWQTSMLVIPVIYMVYRSYSLYLERLEAEKQQAEVERGHAQEMASLHLRTIEALALAIEAKDQTTHDHLRRVEVYCMEMARRLELSDEDRNAAGSLAAARYRQASRPRAHPFETREVDAGGV